MKKLILILSILALNAFAVNCRDYMRLSVPSWDFEEYHLDSVYAANYFGSFVYYTVLKYHYTNSNLDSIVRCVDVDDCEYTHTKIMTEKTNTSTNRTIYTNDIFFGEEITSIDGDSSSYISYDMSKDTIRIAAQFCSANLQHITKDTSRFILISDQSLRTDAKIILKICSMKSSDQHRSDKTCCTGHQDRCTFQRIKKLSIRYDLIDIPF